MKKLLAALLMVALLLSGCGPAIQPNPTNPTNPPITTDSPTVDPSDCAQHKDANDNGSCDDCGSFLLVYIDLYSINDLHGKLADGENHPGVDELTTYLKNAREEDDYSIFLSAGDMWQGSSESNLTNGQIIVDWMNELDFTAMSLGNHEYDWGSEFIEANSKIAEFPFLAINVFDRETNQRVEYCDASVVVECGGLQIGIIGAIGDCYSSISPDKCADVYFKTGSALTNLVKEESTRLQNEGVDFVVYLIHDGYANNNPMKNYYDTTLSDGYVDIVFEGHTHQGYRLVDEHGVCHLQNKGDNKGGISHAEIAINTVTASHTVRTAELVTSSKYGNLSDDPIVEQLLEKYEDKIDIADVVQGYNKAYRSSNFLCNLAAQQYYKAGLEKWGKQYDIVLGGGFFQARSPYNLQAGDVTYGDLYAIFPFDNELTLCSIKGSDLSSKFFHTSNENYYISYGAYGESVKSNIKANETYYVIVDSYTAYYAPNRLTVVETYGDAVYARDLLADYIRQGGLA